MIIPTKLNLAGGFLGDRWVVSLKSLAIYRANIGIFKNYTWPERVSIEAFARLASLNEELS